jgi:tetratricopeptide (TPR) repeat protein
MSVSLQEESGAESPQREIANENSNEQSDDRNKAFLHSSMLSDGSQTKAVSNVSTRDDTFASLPFVEVTVDSSMDQPSDEAESFARSPPSKVKDISHISADTQVRVAPHYIPRTTAPVAQPPSMNSGQPEKAGYLPSSLQRGSDQMAAHSNSQLMSGLRDLSLESAFERDGQNSSAYFAEESCLIGGIGGDNDRATSLFLSMLTHEDSYHADNSRTLSSHEIMVVRPMEGAGFDSPVQGRSKQMGSMASFSRALAQQKRASHRHELGEADDDETGKPYYDSPTMQLNGNGSMYAVSPKATPESDYVDNGDNGLAPLGGKWDSSRNLVKGKALTKEILDNPHDNLDRIYDAAGRYLKVSDAWDGFPFFSFVWTSSHFGLYCLLRTQRNQYREALHLFQIILDCQRRQLGELHPDVGSAWHNVGVALLRSERHDKALEAFERAVRVRKGSLGKEHPEVAVSGNM